MPSLLDRLTTKFTVDDDCWEWTGGKNEHGYGTVRDAQSRMVMAHRAVYETAVGPIPAGLVIDHLCRNPGCVNPDHLEPVTQKENIRRGRRAEVSAAITHCPQGHEYTPENTAVIGGGRKCRTCRRASRMRLYWETHTRQRAMKKKYLR